MFTDEQKAAIAEIVANLKPDAGKEQKPANPASPGDQKPADQKTVAQQVREELEAEKNKKSVVDQAKSLVDAEKDAAQATAKLQESIKFNMIIKDFIEKNSSLLPEESGKILSALSTKNFKDDNEKADKIRANLIDSFIEKKENLEPLTAPMQARVAFFKTLADSDKEKRSSEFWDLVETGAALKAGQRKAEALNRVNGTSGNDSADVIQSKFMAAAKERFKPQQI